ncbi:hypothetical protein ACE6H2_007046 [Prunus campanulata]
MVSKAKLMIAADEKIQGKALTLSHTKTAICTIKDKFSEQQLERLKDSCFGHLLVIEDLKWTTQIIHGLLLRKADPRTVSQVFPAFAALHIVVREHNAQVPRILQWRINSLPRFHEVMSQVFENAEVDVQPLRPSVIEKQQPYWSWGDDVDETEEVVELCGDDDEPKTTTSASVQEKDDDIAEIASRPSSSKGDRAAEKKNSGLNEGGEGHEDLRSPHMNEGPLHDYGTPHIEPAAMETKSPGHGAEPSAALVVEEAQMVTSVPHLEVHEAADHALLEKLPTPEDVAGCDEICKRMMFLLEGWKNK